MRASDIFSVSASHFAVKAQVLMLSVGFKMFFLYLLSFPVLRTFARRFSNIDFFLKILPLKDDELVLSEM